MRWAALLSPGTLKVAHLSLDKDPNSFDSPSSNTLPGGQAKRLLKVLAKSKSDLFSALNV